MTLRIPNEGELELLRNMLSGTPAPDLKLKLFTNDIIPGNDDTASSYTEMVGMGYTEKTLAAASWTFAHLSLVAEATHLPQVWTFTAGGPVTIYGYYVVGATDGLLRWAERFTPAFSAEIAGDKLTVTPKMTFSTY